MEHHRSLGKELREVREEAELTQEQLAQRLGISRVQVSRIESGARSTGIETVRRWYRECGYELAAAEVGTPQQATSLAMAIASLPEGQLDSVIRIIQGWASLTERERGRVLGIIEAHEV